LLFNSVEFIFLFLPATLAAYGVAGRLAGPPGARVILLAASVFFYCWWDIRFFPILFTSFLLNYVFGLCLASAKCPASANRFIITGICLNLASLAYFKYIGLFTEVLNQITGAGLKAPVPLLPLGISFFTFHQITYLAHVYRERHAEKDAVRYGLFVAFFPQLLAGPITYAREMLPQFGDKTFGKIRTLDMAVGLSIFAIGLFKKVLLADSVAPYADQVFDASSKGAHPTFFEAWVGVIAYALQIYFDFSGYSDMAIGLARMFGIRLPLNFHSPYKATSIIEFWRRWHISLSRFLRDYLYVPLGGNRSGEARRLANLMVTMLLGGLWHGAAWTFVVWGGLHGVYLIMNHAWRKIGFRLPVQRVDWFFRLVTFVAVCVAWVFFRADSLHTAFGILRAMGGGNGVSVALSLAHSWPSLASLMASIGFRLDALLLFPDHGGMLIIAACAGVAFLMPNTQQFIGQFGNALDPYNHLGRSDQQRWQWQPTWQWGIACAIAIGASLLTFERTARFLYFQF
jgi:D-alanyl-lipoteichoic acid acyltransferase DltB (MBOAT superfamily)